MSQLYTANTNFRSQPKKFYDKMKTRGWTDEKLNAWLANSYSNSPRKLKKCRCKITVQNFFTNVREVPCFWGIFDGDEWIFFNTKHEAAGWQMLRGIENEHTFVKSIGKATERDFL